MPIESMGHVTAIGMRTPVTDPDALVINTCSDNDTDDLGTPTRWSWSNPTNRRYRVRYCGLNAVSTEAMWQGTKIVAGQTAPNPDILNGDWRKAKGKRPIGAWAGEDQPLITTPGEARRAIYIPCFASQILQWAESNPEVRRFIATAQQHKGPVFLRDFDTGRGVDRNGPLSHAWVLATWLNTGSFPA